MFGVLSLGTSELLGIVLVRGSSRAMGDLREDVAGDGRGAAAQMRTGRWRRFPAAERRVGQRWWVAALGPCSGFWRAKRVRDRVFPAVAGPGYWPRPNQSKPRQQEGPLPRSLKQERQQLEEDEKRLQERRAKLAEAEQKQAMEAIAKSGLLKLDEDRLNALLKRIKALGMEEVERRLQA